MASRRASVVATVVGASAGLSAYLPSITCAGAPCPSCLACLGAGGAAFSALAVGFVSHRIGLRPRRDGAGSETIQTGGAVTE
jgi:hypothetical protein